MTCDRNLFYDYRSISLLLQCKKLSKKLFEERLENCLTINNLLNDRQYGFRCNRLTIFALIQLNDENTFY